MITDVIAVKISRFSKKKRFGFLKYKNKKNTK